MRKIKQKEKNGFKNNRNFRNLLCDWKLSFTIGEEFISDLKFGGMNMSINWQEIVFNFWEGWGSFSYSIKTMGEGLQQAAGDRLLLLY